MRESFRVSACGVEGGAGESIVFVLFSFFVFPDSGGEKSASMVRQTQGASKESHLTHHSIVYHDTMVCHTNRQHGDKADDRYLISNDI